MRQRFISERRCDGHDTRHIVARKAAQILPGRRAPRKLNEAITLQLGNELLVRDGRLVAALCDNRQISSKSSSSFS
jgi:hypothetical protein